MSTNYSVVLEEFANRHYISKFKKKYKGAWDVTWEAIVEEFKRIDSLLETSIAETIVTTTNIKICKTEFRVAKTQESRHGSGNRCIIAVREDIHVVHVLLVYHKNDLRGHNETAAWKKIIKDNYSEYFSVL
ncbi:MAG: hypothetical protein NUV82_04230 [Candidatus Komeilibacteria bacterium]|nr:hypothetical protein [Candidatus Komeilibacteria bacterium]